MKDVAESSILSEAERATNHKEIYTALPDRSPAKFQEGCMAILTGLQARDDLNGAQALLLYRQARACRWAVFLPRIGKEVSVRPRNLSRSPDLLLDMILTDVRLGNLDNCADFMNELLRSILYRPERCKRASVLWTDRVISNFNAFSKEMFSDVVNFPSGHYVLAMKLHSMCHQLAFEFFKHSETEIRGRVLQSWIVDTVEYCGVKEQHGYTARRHAEEYVRWTKSSSDVKRFFNDLQKLQEALQNLVADELWDYVAADIQTHDPFSIVNWVSSLLRSIAQGNGVTLVPGKFDRCDAYIRDMIACGHQPRAAVFVGPMRASQKPHLAFSPKFLRDVLKLGFELFHANLSGATFLEALLYYGAQPIGPACSSTLVRLD